MFQSFQQGKDRIGSEYEETQVRAGRFRAHFRPAQSSCSHAPILPHQASGLLPLANQLTKVNLTLRAPLHDPDSRGLPARRRCHGSTPGPPQSSPKGRFHSILRPDRDRVFYWMDTWLRRSSLLVCLPSFIVWIWCLIPFPVQDPFDVEAKPPTWNLPPTWTPERNRTLSSPNSTRLFCPPKQSSNHLFSPLPPDFNLFFFVLFYFGFYLFIGLMFITKLFDLYRLNWWPKKLGARLTYFLTWTTIILLGFGLHYLNLITGSGADKQRQWNSDWERKSSWVLLEFVGMMMPICACLLKLKGDRRGFYRRSMTETQKTFLEHVLGRQIPASYIRFWWFIACLIIGAASLIIGQGFASIYLSTLPHSSLDGLFYVWSWTITLQILNGITCWIMENKIRSKALLLVFKYYFILTYFIFYRNLFARLKDPSQYLTVQILSSSWILFYYPISMSKMYHRILTVMFSYGKNYEDHLETIAHALYLRNLAENVTMLSFLGWLTILHFGPNHNVYPFFNFQNPDRADPYTYKLTMTASVFIWTIELVSSFLARGLCWLIHGVHVTNAGLNEFRTYPELAPACIITSVHVLSDMLLFLLKLNFR